MILTGSVSQENTKVPFIREPQTDTCCHRQTQATTNRHRQPDRQIQSWTDRQLWIYTGSHRQPRTDVDVHRQLWTYTGSYGRTQIVGCTTSDTFLSKLLF